ncbi:unnamed protein product, partial [marine sediment metagenome]
MVRGAAFGAPISSDGASALLSHLTAAPGAGGRPHRSTVAFVRSLRPIDSEPIVSGLPDRRAPGSYTGAEVTGQTSPGAA